MTIDSNDLLNSILQSIEEMDYVRLEDIPNIDLYMDQVTTFMEEQMKENKRYPEDKVLTKTMINNYAKNHLLPAPIKKKYSKEHILTLIYIYYLKNILSIKDIETLLKPLTEQYFSTEGEYGFEEIYKQICELEKSKIDTLKADVEQSYHQTEALFGEAEDEQQKYLQLFAFICSLGFDVYVKKLLIEKLVDEIAPDEQGKKKK
mgnify:CR=1 FL=1